MRSNGFRVGHRARGVQVRLGRRRKHGLRLCRSPRSRGPPRCLTTSAQTPGLPRLHPPAPLRPSSGIQPRHSALPCRHIQSLTPVRRCTPARPLVALPREHSPQARALLRARPTSSASLPALASSQPSTPAGQRRSSTLVVAHSPPLPALHLPRVVCGQGQAPSIPLRSSRITAQGCSRMTRTAASTRATLRLGLTP